MTDLLDRIKKALADRYTIEREFGRGGMAVVYLVAGVMGFGADREGSAGCAVRPMSGKLVGGRLGGKPTQTDATGSKRSGISLPELTTISNG